MEKTKNYWLLHATEGIGMAVIIFMVGISHTLMNAARLSHDLTSQ
jgi:hypothetical protein